MSECKHPRLVDLEDETAFPYAHVKCTTCGATDLINVKLTEYIGCDHASLAANQKCEVCDWSHE